MAGMGRRRTVAHDLPPSVTAKIRGGKRRYYWGRNQVALGDDYTKMLLRVAELTAAHGRRDTFAEAVTEYLTSDEYKRLKPATQRSYSNKLKPLLKVFAAVRLDDIEPAHVWTYMNARPAKHAATAEKRLLGTVFDFARRYGMTRAPSPTVGIRGVESKRKVYVTDEQLEAVLGYADDELRDFLLLAYHSGQDVGRVINWTAQDVRGGLLWNERSKTGEKVRVEVAGPLQDVLARLVAGKVGAAPLFTRSLWTMRRAFWVARGKAGQSFWLRDLRAKAGTDVPTDEDANALLAHADMATTAIYRRNRAGRVAQPVMRKLRTK